jgi:hypothetical protein
MRFYVRTGNGGMSVGVVGGLVLLVLLATAWFYMVLIVAVALVLYGVGYGIHRLATRRRS